jgi:hypothetical protein
VGRFDNTKENYKAAWRYVWKVFKREGALPWVRFVWSTVFPYSWGYPGDRYVRYVGLTVLNFGANRKWREPGPLIAKKVGASLKITKRPIIITELATDYLGGDKAQWLRQATSSYRSTPRSGPSCISIRTSRIASLVSRTGAWSSRTTARPSGCTRRSPRTVASRAPSRRRSHPCYPATRLDCRGDAPAWSTSSRTDRASANQVREALEVLATTGTIKKVVAERVFGFITAADTKEYFFHRNSLDS